MKFIFLILVSLKSILTLTANDPVKHTVLSTSNAGIYRNYNILVDGLGDDPKKIKATLQAIKNQYCSDGMCNGVTIWNNVASFNLEKYRLQNQPTSKDWNKKNWVKLSEGLVVFYVATVNEANIFPYLDETYRSNGGKKKRPAMKRFSLQ